MRRWRSAIALLTLLPGPTTVRAAPPADAARPAQKVYLFNIPAQPLPQALLAYGGVVGNQIIYDSRLAQNLTSSPVVGLFTADVALRLLLDGTGLSILPTGSQDVYLEKPGDPAVAADGSTGDGSAGVLVLDTLYVDVPPGAEQQPDFTAYGALVGGEIRRALHRNPATTYRLYDVRIELWVDEWGRVNRPTLVKSSGDARLDLAILRAIENVTLAEPPPKGMPQPVRAAILGL